MHTAMHNSRSNTSSMAGQRGAALVIGLILLLVLTLLAVTGMNTASTELIMAGNEQQQENAFQAAELGIERAMEEGLFETGLTENQPQADVPNSTIAHYTISIAPESVPHTPRPAMWGNRWDSFSTFHFQVTSLGASTRGATTTHTQGMFVISPFDPSTPPPLAGGPTDLSPP